MQKYYCKEGEIHFDEIMGHPHEQKYAEVNEPFFHRLSHEVRRRVLSNLIIFFGVWPFLSIVAAALEAQSIPYFYVSLTDGFKIAFAGAIVLAPDFFIVGTILSIVSLFIYSAFASKKQLQSRFFVLISEPTLLLLSIFFGTALYYPTVLNHPALNSLSSFPIWMVTILLGACVIAGCFFLALPGARLRVILIVLAIGLLNPVPVALCHFQSHREGVAPPLVLLGLDSLSHHDNLMPLKSFSARKKGTWYSHAVTPGLLTNAVWVSLFTMQPIHDHGVFHIFQPFPKQREKEDLIMMARKAGYRTVSVFPDQTTDWCGTDVGFDEERCGPVGWRQLATAYIENASILLPIFRPLLPKLPFSDVPPNHLGTFTYNIDHELDDIFSLSSSSDRIFAAGHLTYLHADRYPSYYELSWKECLRIMRSAVALVKDRSFDWKDEDRPTDPIKLHEWKTQRLQNALADSMTRTKFLERGGRLVLFSDHGNRPGLTMDTFRQERYHHVLLTTFGLPSRDPDEPISLIEAGSLLGLAPHASSFDPDVEFVMSQPSDWPELGKSARVHWDGSITLNDKLLNAILQRLRAHRPWPQAVRTLR